ncbi:MAG TPA: NADH-quinone oxidoreductase subunit 15 [Trueperaceae bacterium]
MSDAVTGSVTDRAPSSRDLAFYRAWTQLLEWMREYASSREGVMFEKEADFTDYIYRMERPYDLPTTIMSASLSEPDGEPVLMAHASPRHAVFKEVEIHPFGSHVHRKLKLAEDGASLAEGKRVFTRQMLESLADELFHLRAQD